MKAEYVSPSVDAAIVGSDFEACCWGPVVSPGILAQNCLPCLMSACPQRMLQLQHRPDLDVGE